MGCPNNDNNNNVLSVCMADPVIEDEPKPEAAPTSSTKKEGVFAPQWFHCVYPRKPATRSDPVMVKLLAQVRREILCVIPWQFYMSGEGALGSRVRG